MAVYAATKMRDENRRKVFDLVRRKKTISRTEISRKISISSPTVMKIINFFQDKQIVASLGEIAKDGPGRRLQQLSFNADAAFAVGISFEGHFLNIGIVNLDCEVKYNEKYYIKDNDSLNIVSPKILIKYIELALEKSRVDISRTLGIGLGVPKIVDIDKHLIYSFSNRSQSFKYQDTVNEIKANFGFPIFLENDVNAKAIGEFYIRNLPFDADMAYVSLGTGLGAGFILNGKLRRGMHYTTGEIGHMYQTLGDSDDHLETLMNLEALERKWGFTINSTQDNTGKLDDTYIEVLEYLSIYLAKCIANIVAILDVDIIVLGGVLAEHFGEDLLSVVKEKCLKLLAYDLNLELTKAVCPGVIGTAMIAIDKGLDDFLGE